MGGEKSSTKCPEALERCLAHGRSCRPGFLKVLSGLSRTKPSQSSPFPSNKAHFHIMQTLLTRRSVEVESHGHTARSRSVSGPASLLLQVHRLHQSLCPLNSARKCCDGRPQDFGIHFQDGRKVLHNFKNAPRAALSHAGRRRRLCPQLSETGLTRLMSSLGSIRPHTHTQTQRRSSAVCFSPQTPSKVKVPSATSASLSL